MEKIQTAGIDEEPPPSAPPPSKEAFRKHKKFTTKDKVQIKSVDNYEDNLSKYSREANKEEHARHKRATRRDENKNTCSLYIQTDPLIWKHIREGFPEVKT